ncbi:MAG: hypothetical protein ACRCXM_08820 [Beijerinckiaceae bacterium]
MFDIDTDNEGMKGPFLSWTPKGSAEKGFAPRSWVLRDKNDAGERSEVIVRAFADGCILDLDDIKLGWERDRPVGGPERRWSRSITKMDPRPDESRKDNGGYAWSKTMAIRAAIGGGKSATWSQSGFAGFDAFMTVMRQAKAEYPNNGTLPLVKQVGTHKEIFNKGETYIPELKITDWVKRPDCLKKAEAGFRAMDVADAPAPTPAPTPAQAGALPDDTF